MSLFGPLIRRTPRRHPTPSWERYSSAEQFAYDLMRAGVDTDAARAQLRAARAYFALQEGMREAYERRKEALEWRQEVNQASAAAAARKLLGEVGLIEEESDPDPAPIGHYYAGPEQSSFGPMDGWGGYR